MRFFAVERTFYKVKSRNDSIVNNGTAAVKKVAVKNQIDGSYILVKTRESQLLRLSVSDFSVLRNIVFIGFSVLHSSGRG